jgi:3-hydroxyacyl-[acyl-carrier-protein] dehydratase
MPGLRYRAMPLDAIDKVTQLSDDEVAGVKHIHSGDPYLEGHYPDFIIYPGVFILESACRLIEEYARNAVREDAVAELVGVRSMRFLLPLRPGDTLHVHGAVAKDGGGGLRAKVTCRNGKAEKVAQLTLDLRIGSWDHDA